MIAVKMVKEVVLKLRQKAFLLILVTFLCLSAGLYQIAQNTLQRHTWQAEEIMARENVARVLRALNQQSAPLVNTNMDWARWNDAYRFIETGDGKFHNDNLTPSTIVTLQAEVVLFARLNGDQVFATGYDLKNQRNLPFPQDLKQHIAPGSLIAKHSAQGQGSKGLLRLRDGILMVSCRPVLHGNGSGPIKGFMLIGRWWDAAMQKQLQEITQLKLTARPWTQPNSSADIDKIQADLNRGTSSKIVELSASTLVGYSALRDITSQTIALLSIETPRPLNKQNQQTLHSLMVSMIFLGGAFSLLMLVIIEFLVLNRLERLTSELDAIGDSADRKARVTVKGHDELGHMAEQINTTLNALSQAHGVVEQRVTERTEQLQETNTALHAEIVERQMMMGTLRELVAQVESARDQAQHASEAKTNFLSRMSHELRTPLNAILGFGQLLEDDGLNEEQQESVHHILKAGHHLLALINEILDITRIEAGTLALSSEPFPANSIIEEVCGLLQPLADKQKVSLVIGAEALNADNHINNAGNHINNIEEAWVCANHQRSRQILLNLVSNAVKYNYPQGTVYVNYHVQGKSVRISVRDNGPGLSDEQKTRLFTPFDRLGAEKTAVEGTGIGLALSKNLAQAMGGSLKIDHQTTDGCLFWLELPLATGPQDEAGMPNGSPVAATIPNSPTQPNLQFKGQAKQLIYVEDDASNRRLLEIMVQKRPEFNLKMVVNGTDAIRMLRAQMPDLLLLDAQLPDIDGEEILSLLRQDITWDETPIVIVTADATFERKQRMLKAGANALLTKPICVDHFWQTVESLLDDHKTRSSE